MKSKIIICDCDGVLLNWNEAFSSWMKEAGYILYDDSEYDISLRYRLKDPSEGSDLVRAFNSSESVSQLRPYEDAVIYVGKLVALGYRLDVISCLSDDPLGASYRRRNLYNVFGVNTFRSITCLGLSASKIPSLEPYRDTDQYWIEDSPSHAWDGAQMGLHALLMDHSYNSHIKCPGLPRFSGWSEIYNYILTNE